MLTSGANQYLRPEYLSPLPTTLDAKKSPLALLAQTCSNIGVDNKPLNLDKSKDHHSHSQHNSHNSDRKKSGGSSSVNSSSSSSSSVAADDNCVGTSNSTTNSSKLSFKPYENIVTTKKVSPPNFNNNIGERNGDNNSDAVISERTSHSRKTASLSPKCNGNSSSPTIGASPSGKNTPADNNSAKEASRKTPSSSNSTTNNNTSAMQASTAATSTTTSLSSATSSALSYTYFGLQDMMLNGHNKADAIASLSSYAAYRNQLSGNCCPSNGIGTLPHLNVDKTGAYPSIYPPLSYSRMKTANGGQSIMPMCRDPYCSGTCQISAMQNAALLAAAGASSQCTPGTCPNGCNQCDHQRLMTSLALTHPGLVPGLSQGYGSNYYPSLSSGLPSRSTNVCNWIVGDTHCGKRFPTSEELLQHLRSHTSSALDPSVSLMSQMNSGLNACHIPHYSTAGSVPPPSLTTAAGLRRTYPTSLGPLANRYHPYKPQTIASLGAMPPVPSGASPLTPSMASLHPSALSMYYSPCGLYSGRLGPPVHP